GKIEWSEGVDVVKEDLLDIVAKQLSLKSTIVKQVIDLLEEGNTVPFIARYRKEATGGLDEVNIKAIQDHWTYAVQLAERKEEVIRLIDEHGKLTEKLLADINKATKLQRVEDLYRPYRQKRRTRATIAKEKGLEPLAVGIWEQSLANVEEVAAEYFSEEHELHTIEEVLQGANDIIAEWISDDPAYRDPIRETTWKQGDIVTTLKNEEKDTTEIFKMYYDYKEPVRTLVSHRILAINRVEKEDVIRVCIEPHVEKIHSYLEQQVIGKPQDAKCAELLKTAIEDSFKRLIEPSVEREIRNRLTEIGEEQAISVFSENLRNLLLQPPLRGRMILAVDPAFRTGCKLAVVDETGKMLDISVMFPTSPRNDIKGAEKKVLDFVN